MSDFQKIYNESFIYALLDPLTKEVRYIGKTVDISRRYKETLYQAKKNKTYKANWIKALKKKGLKPLLEIIDIVNFEEESFWEKHYISLFKSWGFKLTNATDGGEGLAGVKKSISSIEKMKKPKTTNGKKALNWLHKYKNTTFSCFSEAYKKCQDETRTTWNAKSFRKLVTKTKLISFEKKHIRSTRRIYQLSMSKKVVKLWDGVEEVVDFYNINSVNIYNVCAGFMQSFNGYLWCYEKDLAKLLTSQVKTKSTQVLQKDTNGNFISEWNSIKEAAFKIGINPSGISNVIAGKAKIAGGFLWQTI